jgi:eukaryotic-like serine/threonine-protein kinase
VSGGQHDAAAPEPDPIAEAPTVAPASPPTAPIPGLANASVHEEATVPPRDPATVDLGSSQPVPPDASEPARVRYFGDYEIIRELARGGMGVVFEARQMSLNRTVALKMILAGQLANDTDVKRFYSEAEAAASLDHPGIVPIFEVGQHEGQHYFSMGFVEGQSLSQRLADGPLPAREAADLIRRVSEAIEYAHQRGVIHRDLKPANILLDQNANPRVTDFGLAKMVQGDSGLTGSGQIMGTPSYMPPEQAGGKRGEVGPAADGYALGATLYALVTGRPPFQAATPMDTIIQLISDEPVPPRRLNASIPSDLETICLKCLEKEPGTRYASAAALGEDLGRYLAGELIMARPVTRSERAVKWARRRPAIAGLLGLVALATSLGLGGVLWQWRAAVRARNVADLESRNAKEQANLAEGRRVEAEARRQEAEQARAKERVQTELAKEQTELAEQRLYDVRMNLVQHYWEDSSGGLLQQGLDEQLPAKQRGIDRRGFEWFYWQRKMFSGHITLKEHTDGVTSVWLSPDGKRLASASHDGTVRVWDVATRQETLTLKGHNGSVVSVAFSPDGKRLASASHGGPAERGINPIWVWDAATGQEILTLKGHNGWIGSVAFSPDGKRLASAGQMDGTVKVWDAATGQETLTIGRYTPGQYIGVLLSSVAFSPDGKRLASAGLEATGKGTVNVWDATTGQGILTLKGHTSVVVSVAFSPDGKRLASASSDLDQSGLFRERARPDGKRLAFASSDRTVKVWDATTGQEIVTLKRHGIVSSVAYSPDGKRLASATYDGTVKVWDATTGQEILTLKGHTSAVLGVAFSRDGQRLTSAGLDGTVKVWDTATRQETLTLKGHTGVVGSVAFSPDGKHLVSASGDRTVKVWDTATGQETLTLKGHTHFVSGVAFSPDGKRIVSAGGDFMVKVWDAATGQEISMLNGKHYDIVTSVAFSPDGKRLASAGGDLYSLGQLFVWNIATGLGTLTLNGHTLQVNSVAFSPNGKRLASASWDGTVKVWDAATGQETLTLKGHTGFVKSVAFSPDGKWIASAGFDSTVKVWDAATGQEALTLKGHTGSVHSVAFSPDGKRIASASEDQTVKVWDAVTGQETLTLKGDATGVLSVAFSPDGKRLASAGEDRTVKVWDARPLDDDPANTGLSSR